MHFRNRRGFLQARSGRPEEVTKVIGRYDLALRQIQEKMGHRPLEAALSNCVVGLLRCNDVPNMAAAVRAYGWSPAGTVLSLLGLAPP